MLYTKNYLSIPNKKYLSIKCSVLFVIINEKDMLVIFMVIQEKNHSLRQT